MSRMLTCPCCRAGFDDDAALKWQPFTFVLEEGTDRVYKFVRDVNFVPVSHVASVEWYLEENLYAVGPFDRTRAFKAVATLTNGSTQLVFMAITVCSEHNKNGDVVSKVLLEKIRRLCLTKCINPSIAIKDLVLITVGVQTVKGARKMMTRGEMTSLGNFNPVVSYFNTGKKVAQAEN